MCVYLQKDSIVMDTAQKPNAPFVICRAAAGSGKTFMLVKEYLKLALALPVTVRADRVAAERRLRDQFRSILAITFTNKATYEMKERVLNSLDSIVRHGTDRHNAPMGQPLLEALNAMPLYADRPIDEAELRWEAGVVHSAIMHQYSDLAVCTIDSFMQRIVRTFAHDLDKPVNYEVMVDQKEMIEQAVAQLMSRVGAPGEEELTRVVRVYADSSMEEDGVFNIESRLKTMAAQFFEEDAEPYVEALSDWSFDDYIAFHRQLTAQSRAYLAQVRACGEEMMALLGRLGVGMEDCYQGKNGFYSFFRKMIDDKPRALTSTVVKTFESGKFHSAKCPPGLRDALDGAVDELDSLYARAYALLGEDGSSDPTQGLALRDHKTRQLLLKNLYAMALMSELGEHLKRYARDNMVVHLAEINRMINGIVSNEPAPFIFERLGNRYRHILIDEFQDTSILQWHNLVPLVENGVSQVADDGTQRYESLVVGDGKQAIYRWRHGDVRQFVDLPVVKGMALHGQSLSMPGTSREESLALNRRTAACVVRFNNAFFTWLLGRKPYVDNPLAQQIYIGTPDAQGNPALYQYLPDPEPSAGHVGVTFVDAKDGEEVYEEVRKTIVRLVTRQGYHQHDIMVLGRTNQELNRIGTYLQTHSEDLRIDITSSESFFLVRSHAVMAVVATLRLLVDGTNRVAAADLLQRLYNLGLTASAHRDDLLEEGPVDVARLLHEEKRGFDFRPEYLASLDLYDCCEEVVRELHLDGVDNAYVGSLLGRVASFVTRWHSGAADFLEWFDENTSVNFEPRHKQLSVASPEGVDAVRLLSIHKAKGLEAPVVICPLFAGRSHSSELWVDVGDRFALPDGRKLPAAFVQLNKEGHTHFDAVRDEEQRMKEVDDLNVLYVALTRPKEQLFIVCPTPSKNSDNTLSYPAFIKAFMDEKNPELGDPDFQHVEKKKDEDDEAPEMVSLQRLSYAEWSAKVKVASRAERALTPLQESSVRFGNYAHDLLAQVRHAGDVDAALARMAADSQLTDDEKQRLAALARTVVTHPDTECFFRQGYEAKTECDLCDDEGVCRPDRVVLADGATWVVDFKTGQDLGEEHDRQVRRYCRAMEAMGYPAVEGWLLYLPEVRVRRVAR